MVDTSGIGERMKCVETPTMAAATSEVEDMILPPSRNMRNVRMENTKVFYETFKPYTVLLALVINTHEAPSGHATLYRI